MDEKELDDLRRKWKEKKMELDELHRQRAKNKLEEATKKAIDLFILFLYKSNNKPCSFPETSSFSDLELKPINLKERLGFILQRPSLFPSYIQLCILMDEQEKLTAKKDMMKKASSRNENG